MSLIDMFGGNNNTTLFATWRAFLITRDKLGLKCFDSHIDDSL